MKKSVAVFCAFVLILYVFVPAAYASEEELLSFEDVELSEYDPSFFGGVIPDSLLDIPEWLLNAIFRTDAPASASPGFSGGDDSEEAPNGRNETGQYYEPVINVPYSVKKTVSYYDKNGRLCYKLILSAVFVDTALGSFCLKSETSFEIFEGSWRITAGSPGLNENTLSADFEVTQLFTGIPVKTDKVKLTLSPESRASHSYFFGDVDLSGNLSASDARKCLRASVGLEKLSELEEMLADMDRDGRISSADARIILRFSVGLNEDR